MLEQKFILLSMVEGVGKETHPFTIDVKIGGYRNADRNKKAKNKK